MRAGRAIFLTLFPRDRALASRSGQDPAIGLETVGHTHASFARRLGLRGLVANPGALLRTSGWGGIPAPGTFGVLELPGCIWTVIRATDGTRVRSR